MYILQNDHRHKINYHESPDHYNVFSEEWQILPTPVSPLFFSAIAPVKES